MKPYLSCKDLSKSFGSHIILQDLSVDIAEGESVALIGPSGCGKTTLLNMMGLLEAPTSGQIYLKGEAYPTCSSKRAMLLRRNEINYLFQSFALIESQTVYQNLVIALHYTKLRKDAKDQAIEKVLHHVGLSSKIHSQVSELSGGEKQRIAIARCLLKPGNLILADEPTGSLDKKMAHHVMDTLVASAAQMNKTLVVVTHDLDMAQKCSRCIELKRYEG